MLKLSYNKKDTASNSVLQSLINGGLDERLNNRLSVATRQDGYFLFTNAIMSVTISTSIVINAPIKIPVAFNNKLIASYVLISLLLSN